MDGHPIILACTIITCSVSIEFNVQRKRNFATIKTKQYDVELSWQKVVPLLGLEPRYPA